MEVDAPLLAYSALAIDRFGYVPYRDLFDFNMPGAYVANIAIGRSFGYTEIGFRLGDLTCLATLLTLTAVALRSFGWRVSCASFLLFGYFYLGYGPVMSLQREYLLLVPIAMALVVAFEDRRSLIGRAATIGLLVGIAATIKPQVAALLPVFAGWLTWDQRGGKPLGLPSAGDPKGSPPQQPVLDRISALRVLLCCTAGFVVPIAATTIWLQSIGALDAFLDIASNYWPLYSELTGARPHHIVQGSERWAYLAARFAFSRDLRHLILIPAAVGVWLALRRSRLDSGHLRKVTLLVGVAVVLELYPLAAGKFWGYHWLPSFYGASLLAALCFIDRDPLKATPRDLVPAMLVVMITAQAPGLARVIRETRADVVIGQWSTAYEIAHELQTRLRPGDEVQPLDWTGGAVHALLLTNTRIATPFLYDFYFYHHVSSPYIQTLRRRLLDALREGRPAFVVAADQTMRLEGPDTTTRFDELADLLRCDYRAVVSNDRFVLYERSDREQRSVNRE